MIQEANMFTRELSRSLWCLAGKNSSNIPEEAFFNENFMVSPHNVNTIHLQ